MNKVKRSLLLLMIVTLLFSFVIVLPSANTNIPYGPVDSEDRDKGIEQIMQAGVEDKCFATAIYDALVVDNYFGDDTKNIREILCEYDGKIDATNRGIKSIVGIEWLRNTQEIDFTNSLDSPNPNIKNEIRDITPLSFEYIMKIGNLSSSTEAEKWFKNRRNLFIRFGGNPIEKYGDSVGRLHILCGGGVTPMIPSDDLVAIKMGGNLDWSVTKNISLPRLERNGQEVKFSNEYNGKQLTYIIENITTINKDAQINYAELNNSKLQIKNIKQSGVLWATTAVSNNDGIDYFINSIVDENTDVANIDTATFNYTTKFSSRIYTPVYTEKEVKTKFKVTKSATCDYSGKKVVGAKYYLYDANTNQRVSDKEYITDINGEILIDEYLPVGEYYLLEFEAPEGFLLNESKISFSVIADQCNVSVSGGDKDLNINAGDIEEDPNTVYIDRNSKDVEVSINDDSNYKLDHIEITYFDLESQTFKDLSFTGPSEGTVFASAEEAAAFATNWINTNKGNAEKLGIIDGKVTVKAYFLHSKELLTSDPRPVMNVEFTKNSSGFDNNFNVVETPLAGATFKLECTHRHTDECVDSNGNYSIDHCIDPHTDCGDYYTDDGCSWSDEVTSGEDDKVVFENINTGIYKMTETVVPDGYLQPNTTWIIQVDASKLTYTIKENKNDNENINSIIRGDQKRGYTIVNSSFNVKVKKIDSKSGEVLQGAVFELFKLEMKDDVKQWVSKGTGTGATGENGLAYFEKLTEGQYMIKEIEASPGYELITDVIEFNVPFEYTSTDKNGIESDFASDTKTVTFTVSDKVGVSLPNTGATLTARIATLGIVIMGIMILLIKKTEKHKTIRKEKYRKL